MDKLLNSAQVKELDRYTIKEIGIPSPVLMERAALSCADELFKTLAPGSSILCICGTGNNGADGIAVARIMHTRGYRSAVFMTGTPADLSPENKAQLGIALRMGVRTVHDPEPAAYDAIVDAIFGTGLNRKLDDDAAALIDAVNASGKYILSVDIPSGISASTGQVLGKAVRAHKTVTFGYEKLGTVLYPGTVYAGEVVVADLGYPNNDDMFGEAPVYTLNDKDLASFAVMRDAGGNKGTFGKVLVIAGSSDICGAAFLAGKAAYKAGAGLVKIYTHINNKTSLQTLLPEALISCYDDENAGEKLYNELKWPDCVVMGPGLGTGRAAHVITEYVMTNYRKPLVIDADGLNVLKDRQELLQEYTSDVIITPHMGEMARLAGTETAAVKAAPLSCAAGYAVKYNVCCVLKDARTYISDPSGRLWVNRSGNDGMATGGSGDVLAGIIGGLCAQGAGSVKAAVCGAYIHGRAGDEALKKKGRYSLTATDIIDCIGDIIR